MDTDMDELTISSIDISSYEVRGVSVCVQRWSSVYLFYVEGEQSSQETEVHKPWSSDEATSFFKKRKVSLSAVC